MKLSEAELIAHCSVISVIIPLIGFVLSILKRKQPPYLRLTGILIIASATSDGLSEILIRYGITPNPIISFYIMAQFILLSHIYAKARSTYREVDVYAVPAFMFLSIYNAFYAKGMGEFSSNLYIFSGVIFVSYSVAFFHWLYQELPYSRIERSFMFWFNSGVFIYFLGSTIICISTQLLISSEEDALLVLLWSIHNVLNIVKNLFFAIAFYMALRYKAV